MFLHKVFAEKKTAREILCCLFPDNAFQIDWILKTLDVTGIGLVMVVLTKQRTIALSPSDKSKSEEYVPRVLFALIQVDVLVRAEVKMQLNF